MSNTTASEQFHEPTTATDRECVLTGAPGENDEDCTTHEHTGSPLALLAGSAVPAEDTSPCCPQCGSGLVLVRREVREVTHRVTRTSIYDGGSGVGLHADIVVSDETLDDECVEASHEQVKCSGDMARGDCDYAVNGDDVTVNWY